MQVIPAHRIPICYKNLPIGFKFFENYDVMFIDSDGSAGIFIGNPGEESQWEFITTRDDWAHRDVLEITVVKDGVDVIAWEVPEGRVYPALSTKDNWDVEENAKLLPVVSYREKTTSKPAPKKRKAKR